MWSHRTPHLVSLLSSSLRVFFVDAETFVATCNNFIRIFTILFSPRILLSCRGHHRRRRVPPWSGIFVHRCARARGHGHFIHSRAVHTSRRSPCSRRSRILFYVFVGAAQFHNLNIKVLLYSLLLSHTGFKHGHNMSSVLRNASLNQQYTIGLHTVDIIAATCDSANRNW
jgi:hypothetical protein